MKRMIAEATQSYSLCGSSSSTSLSSSSSSSLGETGKSRESRELTLILFDEIDIVFPEDTGLYLSIQQLSKVAKCPIVLTSERDLEFLSNVSHRRLFFRYPSLTACAAVLDAAAVSEKPVCEPSNGDLNLVESVNGSMLSQSIQQIMPTNAPAQLSNSNKDNLRLVSMLCAGDLRAALLTMQISSGASLTSVSPCSLPSPTPTSFTDLLVERDVDFACFDTLEKSLMRWLSVSASPPESLRKVDSCSETRNEAVVRSVVERKKRRGEDAGTGTRYLDLDILSCVAVPVVSDVEPRAVHASGGQWMRLTGRHFLQLSPFSIGPGEPLRVSVLVGETECQCVVVSDSELCFRMPAIPTCGSLIVSISVRVALSSSQTDSISNVACRSYRTVSACSSICGSGNAWVAVYNSSLLPPFPLFRLPIDDIEDDADNIGNENDDDVNNGNCEDEETDDKYRDIDKQLNISRKSSSAEAILMIDNEGLDDDSDFEDIPKPACRSSKFDRLVTRRYDRCEKRPKNIGEKSQVGNIVEKSDGKEDSDFEIDPKNRVEIMDRDGDGDKEMVWLNGRISELLVSLRKHKLSEVFRSKSTCREHLALRLHISSPIVSDI